MSFDWLERFQQTRPRPANYAEKTLAAYRRGMQGGGSIRGVRIEAAEEGCEAAQALPAGTVYHPNHAPLLPLPGCSQPGSCRCTYRPVMGYERSGGANEEASG